MTTTRTVAAVYPVRPTADGAGVPIDRAFGFGLERVFDPFLMLDHFHGDDPAEYSAGFPWHPHRGIETITYLMEGEVEHGDSMGNKGRIGPGDVQWMTAGSGVIHQEMPEGNAAGRMSGFQLWANLPARDKMMPPRYQGIEAASIPVVETADARVRVICGQVGQTLGPVRDIVIEPDYLDVELRPNAAWSHPTPAGHTVFVFLFAGSATFGPGKDEIAAGGGVTLLLSDGDEFAAAAGTRGARFLLVSGKPLREPIAWGGPIVMNTEAELRAAFAEYRAGTFVKQDAR